MDAEAIDVLVYPTIRTTAALVGEPQRGSNCQLSASTGMPALSVPAGWAGDLPVGIELLGRPFDDARLVGFGYALERSESQRRSPHTTPPLVNGAAPAPVVFEARGDASGSSRATLEARFTYDGVLGTLAYDVHTNVPGEEVLAIVLRHADEQGRPYVAARLGGPGSSRATGTITVTGAMRGRLEDGELWIEMMTLSEPFGIGRVGMIPTRR
jgi:hypothetical protein